MPAKKSLLAAVLVAASLTLASCADKEPRGREIARVGDSPITVKDFQKEVTVAARRDPTLKLTPESLSELLDSMIDRKLLIQQAVERGITEDERFIETIKAYWEQTLIRELIDARMRDWSEKIFVTEEEARSHYRRMSSKVTVRVAHASTRQEARAMADVMLSGGLADGEDQVGPLFADDIPLTSPLYESFDVEPGTTAVVEDRDGYVALMVTVREPVEVPPYGDIEERLKGYLLEQKKQRAFEDWLADVREASDITVDRAALEEVARE